MASLQLRCLIGRYSIVENDCHLKPLELGFRNTLYSGFAQGTILLCILLKGLAQC